MTPTGRKRLLIALYLTPAIAGCQARPAHPRTAQPRWAAPLGPPQAVSFASAYREAQASRMQAREAAIESLEALEATAPGIEDGAACEAIRQRLMVADRTGALRRALGSARAAARLALCRTDLYRAVMLLVLLESDSGNQQRALQEAFQLVHLQPRNPQTLRVLQRAALYSGYPRFARQVGLLAGAE